MAVFSLRTAAQQAVKSTILRAIKSGRLSATKTAAGHDAPPDAPATVAPETAVLIAVMETELKACVARQYRCQASRDRPDSPVPSYKAIRRYSPEPHPPPISTVSPQFPPAGGRPVRAPWV